MKKKSLLLLLLSFYLCMCSPDSVRVQSVRVDGKPMQVVSERMLSPQMAYLMLRETANAPVKAFLKTQSGIESTVFSELELRSFLESRKLEDLGKVMMLKQSGKGSLRYIVKGNTNVFVATANNQFNFFEIEGSLSDLMSPSDSWLARAPNTSPGAGTEEEGPSLEHEICRYNCLTTAKACINNASQIFYVTTVRNLDEARKKCMQQFMDCRNYCDMYVP